MTVQDITALQTQVTAEIARVLGYSESELPISLNTKQVAKILNKSPGTLAVWRSTGRYKLEYYESGSDIEYFTFIVVNFMIKRMRNHTGGDHRE